MLYQLSYNRQVFSFSSEARASLQPGRHRVKHSLAPPAGFEPTTLGLEGRCSVQLSYGSYFMSGRPDSNRRPSAPKADALPDCATPRLGGAF